MEREWDAESVHYHEYFILLYLEVKLYIMTGYAFEETSSLQNTEKLKVQIVFSINSKEPIL